MQYLAVIVKASLRCLATIFLAAALLWLALPCSLAQDTPIHSSPLHWQACPPIPDALGLAGPVVGVHNDIVIAGGGANFAHPVWESTKRWHDKLYALDLKATPLTWRETSPLPTARGYSACISTAQGIVVVGGNDPDKALTGCWLIRMQRGDAASSHPIAANFIRLPDLPEPLANAQGALVQGAIMVCTGQTGNELSSATAALWQLDWPFSDSDKIDVELPRDDWRWQRLTDHPGGARSFAIVTALRRGAKPSERPVIGNERDGAERDSGVQDDALIVIGGRRQSADQAGDQVRFLSDTWIYEPKPRQWQRKSESPLPITAGTAASTTTGLVALLSGDDGRLFTQTDKLRDDHPGFPKRAWIYDAGRDQWSDNLPTPANQVTTTAFCVGADFWLISGEIRPRVRTPNVWKISVVQVK